MVEGRGISGRDRRRIASQDGQASIEWVALVLLVALLLAALLAAAIRQPATTLAETIAGRMLCAVGVDACGETPTLIASYGPELAAVVRDHAPGLFFERGESLMPVDFRSCRRAGCADHAGSGRLNATSTGRDPVAFTRVLDCRKAGEDPACADSARENLYIQYWFYYPESATFEGVPVLEDQGHHAHDWESYQVRIGPDGEVVSRASSHHGHNHRQGVANWASDAGLSGLNSAIEAVGLRPRGGWGQATGRLFVTAGSHAGNVEGKPFRITAYSEPDDLHLIPLEEVADDFREPDFAPITPPWQKQLWRDPEAGATS